MSAIKNVVVVGGSYVGSAAVKELASVLPKTHRILLVEPHSHFHHLFVFPRFSVVPGHEHKAFIPYSGAFADAADPSQHSIIKARAVALQKDHLILDQAAWQGSEEVPFEYVVITTGTRLPLPGTMSSDEKLPAVEYLQSHQQQVKKAQSIVIVGGGAVGVQMATDLKESFPEKEVTLVHSREKLMPLYHQKMTDILKARFAELGVRLITGTRGVIPKDGFPTDGSTFDLELTNGQKVSTNLVITATGQKPNNEFLQTLPASAGSPIVNPANGFIKVRPTLQFQDPAYPNFFAAGDIADSGAHKAARPGMGQARVVAENIMAMIQGKQPTEKIEVTPPGIHLSLGLSRHMIFRNPAREGAEPSVDSMEGGTEDMDIESVWARRGVTASSPRDYHL